MDGRLGGHVSQSCAMCKEENAGQSMKCLGCRHWGEGVKTDACCVFVMDSCVQGMRNESTEVWGVC
jgi:hypothetical protein